MKAIGKSSSRKLRRVIYYLLYRMDPQKTHYKISVSANISKIKKTNFVFIFPPLTPIALRRALFVIPYIIPHSYPLMGAVMYLQSRV